MLISLHILSTLLHDVQNWVKFNDVFTPAHLYAEIKLYPTAFGLCREHK